MSQEIRMIFSQCMSGNMENCWNHSYRHRLFKAHNSSTDLSKTKRAKKENPASAMPLGAPQVEREVSQSVGLIYNNSRIRLGKQAIFNKTTNTI